MLNGSFGPWHRNNLRVEWGIGVLSTAGQQPPARLREVALASSALDNLDAHQIHFGAIDLISDILALKLFRTYGVPDSVAKASLAHFSSDLAVDLPARRRADFGWAHAV